MKISYKSKITLGLCEQSIHLYSSLYNGDDGSFNTFFLTYKHLRLNITNCTMYKLQISQGGKKSLDDKTFKHSPNKPGVLIRS